MRIAFDQQIFQSQVYGGISRYFYRLVENLSACENVEAKIFCPFYRNHYISKLPKKNVSGFLFLIFLKQTDYDWCQIPS